MNPQQRDEDEMPQTTTSSPDPSRRLKQEMDRQGIPEPDIEEERDQPPTPPSLQGIRPSELAGREADESTI
jgi:hypothetical protein